MNFKQLSYVAHDWAVRAFGLDHVKDLKVRSLRTLEEVVELAQTLDVERVQAHAVVDMVFDREKGNTRSELGGSLLTIVVLCAELRIDPEAVLVEELRRVLDAPLSKFSGRNEKKIKLLEVYMNRLRNAGLA